MFQGISGWGLPWQPHRDELRIFPPGRSWVNGVWEGGEGAWGYLREEGEMGRGGRVGRGLVGLVVVG